MSASNSTSAIIFGLRDTASIRSDFDAYAEQLAECDRRLEEKLAALARCAVPEAKPGRRSKNAELRAALQRVCGVDLTRIDGIDVGNALKVIAEIGPDLTKFKSVKHFCSWLGLCPGTKISGGKRLSGRGQPTANRVAQALRLAAVGLVRSKSALGAYYRRMCGRMDKPKAVKAAAHKLARLIYTMLTQGSEYVDRGQDYYEQRYRIRVLANLAKKAASLGFQLQPVAPAEAA